MSRVEYRQLSRVIAVANGKGGVFKTSLAANMAGLAASAGHRVLLVDMDPQGDLGDDLGFFDDPRADEGEALAGALVTGAPLPIVLDGVRRGLDVVPGGPAVEDVSGALLARSTRGASTVDLLARSLIPVAGNYDLIFIDTPPTDARLQSLALGAARWLIAPAKADKSSLKAIGAIAQRMVQTRSSEHSLDLLAVVLAGVPTAATRVRGGAVDDLEEMLGSLGDALVPHVIRSSEAAARDCRDMGLLAHELAEQVEGAEPFWKALQAGEKPKRLPGTAPALADDYVQVTQHVLQRLNQLETQDAVA